MVGTGTVFATHVTDITLQVVDTITDTGSLYLEELWNLETIKIGDKYYIMVGGRSDDHGFQVLDITDPTNIHSEGTLADTNDTVLRNNLGLNFHQIGTSIYALTTSYSEKGMQIINVTDPSNPTAVSKVTYPNCIVAGSSENPGIRDAAAVQIGDHHYAMAVSADCNKFHWINITNTTHPTKLFTGSVSTNTPTHRTDDTKFVRLQDPVKLFFRQVDSEHFAYIGGSDAIQIVDVTNPTALRSEGFMTGLGNEPGGMMLHQVGSKSYLIASISSHDDPVIQIHNITDKPVHSADADNNLRISTIRLEIILRDFDIFEMDDRTYLAVTFRNGDGVSFVDITDPARPFEVTRVKDGTHGFNLLHTPNDASAIKIGGEQYVAVGGDEGVTMIHVRPYGQPALDIAGVTGGVLSGTAPSFNVNLSSDATELSFTVFGNKVLDADTQVTFKVKKAVYTKGQQIPSSVADVHAMTFSHTRTSEDVTINMTHYNVTETSVVGGAADERIRTVAHDWDNEYALIMIMTETSKLPYVGTTITNIYVTGATTQSGTTQEEGALSLPTSITLSLGQSSVGEDIGTVNITATLDAPAPPDGVSVSLYSSGGTATEGTDYTLPASITIPAGERSASASITILDDTVAESDESATISTYVDIFGQAMTDSITLTITDNDDTAVVEQDNRAPAVSAAIADVIIPYEGGTNTISLSGAFSDADNDSLNITASSSDETIASVSVASDYTSMTLTGKAQGIANITVTANDGNGGTISDVFAVTVKAAPTVSSAISDVSGMSIGDTQDISLASVFSDADNDSLNITASTSDYNIAEAIIFQDTLTIIAVGNGSATITVTAQDVDDNQVSDTFEVTVGAQQQQQQQQQNQVPIVSAPIANTTIPYEGGTQTISLSGAFSDADNDSLNITASSSDETIASMSVASDYTSLTLTGYARGTATITVTANDGNGGTVSDVFTITVKAAPTVSSAISDVSGLDVGDSRVVSISGVFSDADGDSLTVTAASSNDTVATVQAAADGSALTLTSQAPGVTTISVTAQDADGNQVSDTFEVTVIAAQQLEQQATDTSGLDPIVAQYDTDGSGAIELDEWNIAAEDYANGKLTSDEIYAISKAKAE